MPLLGQKSVFLALQEATGRNKPLDFHRESTQGRNPTLQRRIGVNAFERAKYPNFCHKGINMELSAQEQLYI